MTPQPLQNSEFDPDSGLYAATMRALAHVGMVDSADGQSALILARRLDKTSTEPETSGTALAAMVREHRNALRAALAVAIPEDDPLDYILSISSDLGTA